MTDTEKQPDGELVAKWAKPKILLMDLPENVETALKAEGYNVGAGTFGRPYSVEMDGGFTPLLAAGDLPNYTEQEIIFIDLSVPDATENPEGELHTSADQYNWWVQHTQATVDPRPRLMAMAHKAFDRTVDHGGVLVVFGLPRRANKFVWARKRYMDLDVKQELEFDNWSFCSLFDERAIRIEPDTGRELVPDESKNLLSAFFRRHVSQMRYFATLRPEYRLSTDCEGFTFYPLVTNKFGAPVGGVIFDKEQKGLVIVLPQCSDRQKEYVVIDLLQNVLTEVGRHLFPHLEGGRWVQGTEYEHTSILDLKAEQEQIRSEAEAKLAELDARIASEREAHGYLHGILTKKSTPLVKDVKTALEQMGFASLVDADEQQVEGSPMQEDLQIHDDSPTLLVEVKGLSGFPREDDTLQIVKYIPRRMKEWNRTDVSGVVIINHQCNLPALKRDDENVFTEQQIQDAIHQDVSLVTTWELFKLLRGMQRWDWPTEAVKSLFYGNGRIETAPANYRRVGMVGHFYDKLSVVRIEIDDGQQLRVGDTIGFILKDRYYQESVESLHVDQAEVGAVTGGQRAGHKTQLLRSAVPDGTVVYLVE